mmetsp:Transcript_27814/g.62096  ORF Transcript_27814/g.62096 Transcript_27814/m.62096 type:complete len:281 (-) Transcript_27814:228-1070(-)
MANARSSAALMDGSPSSPPPPPQPSPPLPPPCLPRPALFLGVVVGQRRAPWSFWRTSTRVSYGDSRYRSRRWCWAPSQKPWSAWGTLRRRRRRLDASILAIPGSASHPGTTTAKDSGATPAAAGEEAAEAPRQAEEVGKNAVLTPAALSAPAAAACSRPPRASPLASATAAWLLASASASAWAKKPSMRSAIRSMIAATKGGFAWKDPGRKRPPAREPALPGARGGAHCQKEPLEPKAASVSGKAEQKLGKWQFKGLAKHSCVTPRRSRNTRITCSEHAA